MVTADLVQDVIRNRFGSVSVSDIRPLGSGMLNAVYQARLIGPDRTIVVRERQYCDPEYGQCFAAERLAYRLLSPGKPKRPDFFGADLDGHASGRPLAVFEFVDGPRLDEVLKREPLPSLLDALAASIASVHSVAAPGFGTLTETSHGPDQAEGFWLGLFEAEAKALESLFRQSAKALRKQFPAWLSQIRSGHEALVGPTLVHGDFHARNVIIDREGDPVLIDWEAARYRSPACDLVQFLELNLKPYDSATTRFLSSYLALRHIPLPVAETLPLIEVFKRFWRIRMGIFLCRTSQSGCRYFGSQAQYRDYLQKGDFLDF